ncbi:Oidioi.mRNA.OKI2018_I69.XSR.g14460.t1.cds [Oikopleura dioica]|uniref:Oidioi.mRNA.OKI2018_I69.XSR.g14460.t1.cds n=1 Tax=Oikopleura dioica TaxID=34765 RepID=A0ABN7SF30_OIKDI|nr:Oidioi.mRNA.OKI2018_I69.XSR.g14460.t1.cds [Oikopleura dioica]
MVMVYYGKYWHSASGTQFQTKFARCPRADIIEFSCGCSIKVDKPTKLWTNPRETFCNFFGGIFSKSLSAIGISPGDSLWSNTNFPKTPHICCPKDPNLTVELTEMVAASNEKYLRMAITSSWLEKRKHSKNTGTNPTIRTIKYKPRTEKDYTYIATKFFLPFFENTSRCPTPRDSREKRILKTRNSKQHHEPDEKKEMPALTDAELIALFSQTSLKEKKTKAPLAVRKSRK